MRIRSKLIASFRWFTATMVLLFATNILPAVGLLQGRAYADAGANTASMSQNATSPLTYTGQGIPLDQQCGANQDPLGANQPYLLFIFSYGGNYDPTSVTLHGINVLSQNEMGNETHFVTDYADPSSLINNVNVTWGGDVGNAQLVISHGCTGTVSQPVTAGAVTYNDECGTANDTYTVPSTAHVTYKDSQNNVVAAGTHAGTGTVTLTAYADNGYTLSSPYTFSHTFTNESCGPTEVSAAAVTFKDKCGTSKDGYTIPSSPHVYYTLTGDSTVLTPGFHAASGSISITAHADNGYALTGQSVFTNDLTDVPCNTESVTLCHATHSLKNPYVEITVSVAGAFNGHLGSSHQQGRDIIPPFFFQGQQYSQNWDSTGQTIFRAGCKVAKPNKVHATAPTKVQITCDKDGSYTIPTTQGVQYLVDGVPTPAGTYTVDSNMTVHITAMAQPGYKLVGKHSWTFKFKVPENCGGTSTSVTPTAPTFAPATCDKTSEGSYTIPTTTGVTYQVSLNGGGFSDVAVGSHAVAPGTMVAIRAIANPGFTLTGTSEWSATIAGASGCVLGETDVCPNILGTQTTVPNGMTKDNSGNCVTPSAPTGKGGGGEVLGTSTTVAQPELVNTGESALVNVIVGFTLIGLTLAVGFGARKQFDNLS
jgi:hypothetical protein